MFGPKLRRAGQPLWLQIALTLYQFASSLELAVVLIFSSALALGWATFVESAYGTPAVQFGVYGTWWFAGIMALLAVNIFCAASIRYPWKRHQTGFVITHIGLLTLLFGCLISRQRGIDAQMPIFEGEVGHRAFEDSHHFDLAIESKTGKATNVRVPFISGPFNWDDFSTRLSRPLANVDNDGPIERVLLKGFARVSGMLFGLAHRDRGVIYDADGVQVEVLDYYSDAIDVDAPQVKLRLTVPQMARQDEEGREVPGPVRWMPVELNVTRDPQLENQFGVGARRSVGGGSLVFCLAGDDQEVAAFLDSGPKGDFGKQGQVVLRAGGETVRINVDELAKGRQPLGKSGMEIELLEAMPSAAAAINKVTGKYQWAIDTRAKGNENPAVKLAVLKDGKSIGELTLFSERPEYCLQDYKNRVFGSYWFDHGEKTQQELLAGAGGSRIDLLQSPLVKGEKPKLYYRYWNRKEVAFAKELPTDGTPIDAFKMKIALLKLRVDEVIGADRPERKVVPVAFDAKKPAKQPAAKLRVTVDGKPNEFWVMGTPGMPDDGVKLSAEQQREAKGDGRMVVVTMPPDSVDIGFGVRLVDFERKLDPGTSQASHYTSIVDFVDLNHTKPLQEDVTITMNAPIDFSDPHTGRSYRLFQESFFGPIRPGMAEYDRYFGPKGMHEGYMSTLTVNLDPGRAVKYTGCSLVVAGIITMFYMRAYFFKPSGKPAIVAKATPKRQREAVGAGKG